MRSKGSIEPVIGRLLMFVGILLFLGLAIGIWLYLDPRFDLAIRGVEEAAHGGGVAA